LLQVCPPAFDGDSDVRVVAIGATHFTFEDRMPVRQLKLRAHVRVALETGLRRTPGIDNRVRRTAALHVQTSGSVT